MSDVAKVGSRQFVEGVGGRLAASKSASYARAVLAVESRNNEYIGRYMLAGDLACVLSSHELGVTPTPDAKALAACLIELLGKCERLSRESSIGDIVVTRELWVVEAVGQETGSWLHVGRNRAESLRGSLPRMFFRDVLNQQRDALVRLLSVLVDKAGPHLETIAPFYHHLQHAGRTSLGEYLLSWATNFNTHFDRLDEADRRLDVAPPPNCGRPIVVDLIGRVGRRLGFSKVARCWQELFITEEFFSEPFFVQVQIAVALARLAEDLRLFMTSEFEFFELADEHASGSSGRPQKKNPFGLQAVINGAAVGAGRLAAQFATNITVSEEADSTYHAYQMYEFSRDVVAWTEFMADVVEKGTFKVGELERKSTLGFAGAREALDILVYEHKIPYRFAHRVCGELVRLGTDGSDVDELVRQISDRLKDYPAVDARELVLTAMGTSSRNIHLNLPAFQAVHAELGARVKDLLSKPVANPVETAISALVAEGQALIASGRTGSG